MKSASSVDEYMEGLSKWKDELTLLRSIVLSTELEEGIKWGAPCYMYQGQNVVGIAAFKSYVGLWFFQGSLLEDKEGFLINAQEGVTKALRQWRFMSIQEIQKAPVTAYIYEAIENFRLGYKVLPTQKPVDISIPDKLAHAIQSDTEASIGWGSLPPSHKREYTEYVAEAKKEETQNRRIEKVLDMLRKRQGLNDKYRK